MSHPKAASLTSTAMSFRGTSCTSPDLRPRPEPLALPLLPRCGLLPASLHATDVLM